MLSITLVIVGITVLVSWQAFERSALFDKLLLNPWSVRHRGEYYRILSHTLVHADFVHLAFNMYTFYSFGTAMETVFSNEIVFRHYFPEIAYWGETSGRVYFVVLYLAGAAVATLPSLRKHADNYGYNAVGASGAVSAVMMAFMILFPDWELRFFFIIPMPGWLGAIVFLGVEHWLSRSKKTNIAHDAHIWGALFGLVFVLVLNPQFFVHFLETIVASFR